MKKILAIIVAACLVGTLTAVPASAGDRGWATAGKILTRQALENAVRLNAARAIAANNRLLGLHRNLFLESNPIPVKWALHEMGLMPDGIRLPLTQLSPACHEPLRQALRQSGVLV